MADRFQIPNQKRDTRSDLQKALMRSGSGDIVPACPFEPENMEHYDENGYCRHLVGFTLPGSKTEFEPMSQADENGRRVTVGFIGRVRNKMPVLKTDKLELITEAGSSRVYRDIDEIPSPDAPKIDTAKQTKKSA